MPFALDLKFLLAMLISLLALRTSDAQAGASLLVDDATMTPAGRCQVESWARAYAPGHEVTAVPACNIADTEFGLGISQFGGPSHGPIVALGAKRLFRDFDEQDWGIGASLGVTWDGTRDHLDGWNINIPASFALDAQRHVVLHANLGWNKLRDLGGALTGGLGLELALADPWTFLGEAYADNRGEFTAQLGMRRALGKNASLDLLLGRQDGVTPSHWFTLGFNILLPN
jgi:hypothetical protein